MSFGKDIFCHGIEPYNFRDTDETVATITANVGQSTAIGPKVAIRRNKPFPPLGEVVAIDMGAGKSSSNFNRNLSPTITCTHGGEPVIGTIDASIYRKNSNQDNSKYIIKTHRKNKMDNKNIDLLMKAAKDGVDVVGLMGSLEANLKLVKDGVLSIDEAITACEDLRNTLGKKAGKEAKERIESGIEKVKEMAKEYESMKEAIKDINNDAPHQQDQLNCQDDAARTLAAGTHGAASHLTKTCVEGEDDDGEEMCVVRRLTPTETARLQGFPDDYTKIDGPETADAPQFKAHGNSWATPCANFMNTRIEMELRRLGHEGTIRYATCCSGVEAHSVSVRDLDWKSVFFSEIEPFPCRLLEKHYHDTPNLGDMTQIHYDEKVGAISNAHKEGEEYSLPSCFKEAPIRELPFKVGDLEVFSGGTPCFTKGAFVLTKEGYKPIEDVVVGDEVVTHKGRFRKVLRVGKKKSSDLVEVTVVGRGKIVCTADHPFPLSKSHRRKNGEMYFDAPELTPIKDGESLYVQIVNTGATDFGVSTPALPKVYNATKEDVFELCGWYVGDGYIRGWKGKSKKAVILCLNSEKIAEFNERFEGKVNYTISKSADIFKVQICCTDLARFLSNHFGELAHGKRIPVWAYNKVVRDNFVKGYFKTDGCSICEGRGVQWSTVSPSLAYGVADAIGHTCVNLSQVPNTKVICGRTVNQRDFYTVRHNDDANRFHNVGMFDCVKVRDVKHLDGVTDWVYNIEVDEDHTYIVNGIVTHNCQSVSVAGKREGMAENSGTRSSLAFHYQRIIDETRPVFTLWENVCFGADTLVTTEYGHKKISEVKVGDKVRSFDGKCHRVERVMETKGKETIKLSVMGAEEIEVTPNHPFYARKKLNNTGDTSKVEFSKPEWVAAGELTQDHYICYKVDDGQNVIDQEKAYSCGRDLAEHNFDARPFFEESIFDLSLDTKKEILRGYFNARWNLDEHNVMSFKTQSHEFALCIARLVRDVYHRGVEIKESRDSWDCSFANGDGFEEDGFVWCPVKKVSPGVKQTVYNLTVADTHTYEANDVVVHNCGVFSSNGGADFIWFVNRCAESGYSLAWRVLDAQYTMTEEFPRAVPQRRRRVWLVGYRGNDWRIPARIVFELDKKLTANPPDRVPGKGFKTLNKDFVSDGNSTATAKPKEEEQSLFLVSLGTDDGSDELLKVSKMIDFSDMPDESDFSKVSMADIFSFVKKVGVPGYVGPVFRTDKKKSKKARKDEPVFDLFNLDAAKPTEAVSTEADESENEEWVGAEKITPSILENIGNAGIMANGRIATISCHEWTSGIQLSPKTQAAWDELVKNKEWLKANELLPEAYDETVCGLSDVLQEDPDEKYNLSWRASFGILKRAKTRGKELPAALGIALVSTIRENAGIVKWAALNGKDTKKNESDLSERENAMLCFNEYIAPVAKFEDVEAVQPKRKNDGESDIEEDVDEADVDVDEDGNPITKDDDFPFGDDGETTSKETSTEVDKPAMPDLANGVINVSGGETAATLLASGDAAVGTTQDANIIALKKEGRFQEDE